MKAEVARQTQAPEDGELLSLEQAIRFLGISRPTIYRMLAQGTLKGLRVGRQWRFHKGDLMSHAMRTPSPIGPQAAGDAEEALSYFRSQLAEAGVQWADEDIGDVDPGFATVIRLCNAMLRVGLCWGASDVHMEPRRSGDADEVLVRYRIDGVLHPTRRLPLRLLEPLVDRFKLMAGMDLGERRLPQQGRIPIEHGGQRFDMRVATLPVCGGEALTVRVLFRSAALPSLDDVNMSEDVRAKFEELLHRPNGVILVSGPTGSGKTTTLYAGLLSVATDGVKVLTVEDPVEFVLPHATQVQVNARGGVTFASALRAIMYHDPDIIMVADVIDTDTADLVVQAALTGHLVICQVHAESASHAIERFVATCSDPYYAGATIIGALNQRLVRRLCGVCSAPADDGSAPHPAVTDAWARLADLAGTPLDPATIGPRLPAGRGCAACRGTGYRGRAALHEIILVDSDIGSAIQSQAPAAEVEALADAQGFPNMAQDGLSKALAGITTAEEVLRVLGTKA